MITHEEIMRRIEENVPCSRDMFVAYIKQQEKKDKLLELYQIEKKIIGRFYSPRFVLLSDEIMDKIKNVKLQIKALEEELK